MTDIKMITLKDVLTRPEAFNWSDSLYLPEKEWTLDTECLIWDPDDVEDDNDELPRPAAERQLYCAISLQIVQSIVTNAREQIPNCTDELLLEALAYYWDNDAFFTS